MSDPHGHGGGGSNIEISLKSFVIGIFLLTIFVVYFYFNPENAKTFIFILNLVQAICVVAILFMANKLWYFMKEFFKNGNAIVKNYEDKLKHHHEHVDEKESLKNKYVLAMEYLHSKNENEWKIGLIELDNFIRLSLLDKGFVGKTTIELVNDAKQKGHEYIKNAEDVAYLRQHLKVKGPQFDFSQQDLQLLLEDFEKFKKTIIPDEHNDHGHHESHDKH